MSGAINGSCAGVNAYPTYASGTVLNPMPNGIIAKMDITDAVWNATNNRLENAANYVSSVTGTGTDTYIRPYPTSTNGQVDLATLRTQDQTMMTKLKEEYCYYFHRYNAALNKLYQNITAATPPTDTQTVLTQTITLNRRVNALVEVMDFLANQRISLINGRKGFLDSTNASIVADLPNLQATADALKSKDFILKTQKEMVRFTEEKNNHIENQISLWGALNILALATIFYVYKKI
jgi:hypothetical protein